MTVNHVANRTRARQPLLLKEVGKLLADHVEYGPRVLVLENVLFALCLRLLQFKHSLILLDLLFKQHVLLITQLLRINAILHLVDALPYLQHICFVLLDRHLQFVHRQNALSAVRARTSASIVVLVFLEPYLR